MCGVNSDVDQTAHLLSTATAALAFRPSANLQTRLTALEGLENPCYMDMDMDMGMLPNEVLIDE